MSVAPPAAPPGGAPRPAGFRTFLTLWTTQTLSLFGTFISQFGVVVWLTQELYPRPEQKPALALALSAATIASTAPLIVFMPIAGAFADRHDRRRIMITADAALFGITAGLVAMLAARSLTLPLACELLVGYSLVSSFHNAAFDSSLPLLVDGPHLPRANGMMMTSYALSQLLAPALAATLIGLPALVRAQGWPLPWITRFDRGIVFAFTADALSFAIAGIAVALVAIPRVRREHAGPRPSLLADVREGILWIARRRSFVWLVSFGSIANLLLAPLMLFIPVLVRDRLHADLARSGMHYETALALVNMAGGIGGVLGGVLVSIWGTRIRRRPFAMIVFILVLAIGETIAGLSSRLALTAAGLFVAWSCGPAVNAVSATLWQSLTPPPMLARALATRRFFAQSFFPLGTFIAGWLAVPFEPWLVVVCSGGLLALVCASQLPGPRLAHLEDEMREEAARAG